MTVNSPPRKHGLSMQTGKERSLTKVRIAPACPRTLFSNFTKNNYGLNSPCETTWWIFKSRGLCSSSISAQPYPQRNWVLSSLSLTAAHGVFKMVSLWGFPHWASPSPARLLLQGCWVVRQEAACWPGLIERWVLLLQSKSWWRLLIQFFHSSRNL